jgi:ribosomal protein S18 acetylase RimI-like enzyme
VNVRGAEHADLVWCGAADNDELNDLHAEAFGEPRIDQDWLSPLTSLSLGWVTARKKGELVGFVNLAWDGMAHAFIVDLAVAEQARRCGIGTGLIGIAREHASAAGCRWLHVDFEERLTDFYRAACGFQPTSAGLIAIPLAG